MEQRVIAWEARHGAKPFSLNHIFYLPPPPPPLPRDWYQREVTARTQEISPRIFISNSHVHFKCNHSYSSATPLPVARAKRWLVCLPVPDLGPVKAFLLSVIGINSGAPVVDCLCSYCNYESRGIHPLMRWVSVAHNLTLDLI